MTETWTTWTSSKLALFLVASLAFAAPAAAPHESGGSIAGDGTDLDFDGDFEIPRWDSTEEIAVYFFFPFLFIALLYKIIFSLLFNRIVDPDSGKNYGFQTSLMAVSATAIMVPSPAWEYIIVMLNSIALIAVATIVMVFVIIFLWSAQAGRENPRP